MQLPVLMSHDTTASIASILKIRLGLASEDFKLDHDTIKVHFTSLLIDLIVNSGRNGSGALCAEHDGKVRGPKVQTCHVVLGSCVNADSHLKNLHLRASVSKTIICSLA